MGASLAIAAKKSMSALRTHATMVETARPPGGFPDVNALKPLRETSASLKNPARPILPPASPASSVPTSMVLPSATALLDSRERIAPQSIPALRFCAPTRGPARMSTALTSAAAILVSRDQTALRSTPALPTPAPRATAPILALPSRVPASLDSRERHATRLIPATPILA